MELTWLTIAASLCMGLGAAFLFVYAVSRDWFRDIEDAKYQVFWSDIDQLVTTSQEKHTHGRKPEENQRKTRR